MKKIKSYVGALLVGLWLSSAFALVAPLVARAQSPAPRVDVATIGGVIDQFTDGYVERVIANAQNDGAQAIVFELDTPGGNLGATRQIVQRFYESPVPIVVYVTPAGARAGSGGVFVTYGAHIAAMTPGTNIGAAHPVGINGEEITGSEGEKITNDTVAFIRSVAEQRGRNADWAEDAVRNSVSVTEQEALANDSIDLIARDRADLLNQLDGRVVNVFGKTVTLSTRNAEVHQVEMNFFEQFFQLLLDPNIALILLNIGTIALIAEVYNPGAVIPAIVGIICLTLAAVALYGLPTNWAAALLIIVGIGMMVLDIKVTGFALTVGGAIAFLLGAFFLFRPLTPPEPTAPDVSVSPWVIGGLLLISVGFFVFVLGAAIRTRNLPPLMGEQTLLGTVGVARTLLNPQGIVLVKSEEWSAVTGDPPIQPGETVQVVAAEGLTLRVKKTP